jgi:hypothetical protein
MVWHRGTIARRKAILDFVQRVTTEAAKDFAPVPERAGPVQSDAVSASLPKCRWSVIARCSLLMGLMGLWHRGEAHLKSADDLVLFPLVRQLCKPLRSERFPLLLPIVVAKSP